MGTFSSYVFALTVALAAKAPAPEGDADALVARGVELRRQKHDVEALEAFRRAHALAPSGRTLAQMGFAEVALKRWIDAEQHLAESIRTADAYASKNRKLLDQQIADARTHIGTLQVVGPAGATVVLDGREAGALPLTAPIRHAEGDVVVAANAPGFVAAEKKVVVEGGKEQTVVLELAPVAAPAVPVVAAAPASDRGADGGRGRGWLVGGLVAGAAVGIGTGATLLYLNGRTSCDSKVGAACPSVYTTRTAGLVALGAGAGAAVAAGIIYWKGRETGVTVGAIPDGVVVAGRF